MHVEQLVQKRLMCGFMKPSTNHSGAYVNMAMNSGLVFGWRHLEQLRGY
jgi:hypothetical protein